MFLHPIMLAGLGGAVIPLLLHLLARARYRDVEWGAMMFIGGADLRQRQSARLSQGMLLLVRMAMVAVLAIALARPILAGGFEGGESGHVTAVIILDCSGSMSFDQNGRTRFDLAQRAAEQILAASQPGDRVALIPMGMPAEKSDAEPTSDLRAIANRIDQLHPGWEIADLKDALSRAAELLVRNERANRDVYVVCDRQALSWQNVDETFAAEWRKRMASSPDGSRAQVHVRTFVVPVGTTDADNIAVEAVRLADPPAIRGQPVEIEVRLHNFSASARADLPLTIRVGDHVLLQTSASLPADQAIWLRFEQSAPGKKLMIPDAGSQVLTAEISTAGYVADDRVESSIDVIEPIKVLLVSGDSRAERFQSETDFVRFALMPHHAAAMGKTPDPCAVTVLAADEWEGTEIDGYQVVVVANVERFSPQQVQALERYVYDGGRVLFAPGSLSRIEDYNAQLYRDGAGILPGELQPPTPSDGSEATSVLGYDATHSIFQFLKGKPDPIPSATIGRYFPTVPRQTYAWPLAWYASGDPFLIEGSSERGRVILMTTSLDSDWTTLPLSNFYLPFLQNAVRYLAANPAQRNLLPGQPIQLSFSADDATRRVWLTDPAGHRTAMDIVRFGQQAEVRTANTREIGRYRVDVEEPGRNAEAGKNAYSLFYVVSPSLAESDLRQLSAARWAQLSESLGFRRIEPTEQPLREVAQAGARGTDLWMPLIVVVLLLGALEMGLARWSSGEWGG